MYAIRSYYVPEGGFYLWVRTPIDDTEFARELLQSNQTMQSRNNFV